MNPATKTTNPVSDAEVLHAAAPLVKIEAKPEGSPLSALAAQLASKPNLAAALVRAIATSHAVGKDATNAFHKYKYASAEGMVEEARVALASNGLAVVPVEQSVNGWEREGENRFELVQTRLLIHTSGESVLCRSAWPIIPDRGRPLDKATAAADTLSLSYFLRDLLLLPRVDADADVETRDDRKASKGAPAPQKPPATANGTSGPKLTEPQRLEIKRLLEQCGLAMPDLVKKCKKAFGKDDPKALTEDEASRVIADLNNYHRRMPRDKQPAVAANSVPREPGVDDPDAEG